MRNKTGGKGRNEKIGEGQKEGDNHTCNWEIS